MKSSVRKLGPVCALALTLVTAASAHAEGPTLEAKRHVLANGLEVFLHEDHRTPVVAVNVYYHVGGKDEEPGKSGFAHLFEHLMFQGSKHVPEDSYFRFLERAGASSINGTTSDDRTNYFETVPKNRLALALWLESDRMGFLLDHVDQATFESQRDVVKNERRQNYENAPYGMVYKFVREALYPEGHPYRQLAIGTPEDLDRASLDDVRRFFRRYYVPNNASLVLAGDIDPAQALKLVEQYFGPIPRGADVVPPKATAPTQMAKRLDVAANVELEQVSFSWLTPAFFAPGDAELDVLAKILSTGKSSRLYKRLVYDTQIAQDVSAGQQSSQLGSIFRVVANAKPEHSLDEVAAALREELGRLQKEGPSDEELARAKTGLLSASLFELEHVGRRADMLNLYRHYTGDAGYLAKDLARYRAVDKAAVQRAAQSLDLSRALGVYVKKDPSAPIAGKLVRTVGVAPRR